MLVAARTGRADRNMLIPSPMPHAGSVAARTGRADRNDIAGPCYEMREVAARTGRADRNLDRCVSRI